MADAAAQGRSPADYAVAYARLGWAVVPLHWVDDAGRCSCGNGHTGEDGDLSPGSRGKHPHTMFARHGSHSASSDPEVVARWFAAEPRLNIGIATGSASGFVAVDIDPRDGGDETWADFIERNTGTVPNTVVARTGGGGEHILFRYVEGQAIRTPGKGIQIKSNGGYIVVEPSRHHSGQRYAWDAEADPLEGGVIADAPTWLITPARATVLLARRGARATGYLSLQRIADLRAALVYIDPDPYETWVSVGMALHSTDAPEAFDLWDEWSQRSAKYDSVALRRKWPTFGGRDGLHVESIFVWARDAGWSGETIRVAAPKESVRVARPHTGIPDASSLGLLQIPGALGAVADFANRTAPRPQPVFAVSAALALGSILTGRRYLGVQCRNWTSLYFINVGKSASGKEHARTVINAVLTAAECDHLIGRSGYASDSAVISALLQQPAHISIIDEIGALLGNTQAEGAFHARAAMTALVEVWGNLHGAMRPKAYSTMALPREQAEAQSQRIVYNPAITLLGMTTPRTFFGALTESAIEGGFLSRLLIIETDIGRQPMGDMPPLDVPEAVIQWCRAVRFSGQTGNLAAIETPANLRPTPIAVPTDPAAQRALSAYEVEAIGCMNALDDEGLAELEGRSSEKALRIAVILAVSVNPEAPRITLDIAEWAIAYVRYWTSRTVLAVREHMHGSRFAQWQAEVLRLVQRAGDRGRSERELAQHSRTFDGLEPRQRRTVLDALVAKGAIALVESAGSSGRGKKRIAWVAVESADDEAA